MLNQCVVKKGLVLTLAALYIDTMVLASTLLSFSFQAMTHLIPLDDPTIIDSIRRYRVLNQISHFDSICVLLAATWSLNKCVVSLVSCDNSFELILILMKPIHWNNSIRARISDCQISQSVELLSITGSMTDSCDALGANKVISMASAGIDYPTEAFTNSENIDLSVTDVIDHTG